MTKGSPARDLGWDVCAAHCPSGPAGGGNRELGAHGGGGTGFFGRGFTVLHPFQGQKTEEGCVGCPAGHFLQRVVTLALDTTFRLGRRSFQSSSLRGHSLSKPNPWGHKFTHLEMSMTSKCLSHYIHITHSAFYFLFYWSAVKIDLFHVASNSLRTFPCLSFHSNVGSSYQKLIKAFMSFFFFFFFCLKWKGQNPDQCLRERFIVIQQIGIDYLPVCKAIWEALKRVKHGLCLYTT